MADNKGRRGKGRSARRGRGRRRLAEAGSGAQYDVGELPNLDLMASLDRVAKMLARLVGEVARAHGATTSQLQVVAALARTPDGLTAKHLAAALAIRPGSLTGMLDTLEERNILQRERVKGDARQQRIVLLEGAQPLVDALAEVERRIDELFASIGDGTRDQLAILSDRTEGFLRKDTRLPMPAVLRITSPVKVNRSRLRDLDAKRRAEAASAAPQPKFDETDAKGRRGVLGISSRVLSAVDAVRKRRDD